MKKLLFTALTPLALNLAVAADLAGNDHLPDDAMWRRQADDLRKYWVHPDALGRNPGQFPTWRCNDGSLRSNGLCADEEAKKIFSRMPDLLNYDYTRMISRQTYAYGALFNLTGDPELLKYHNLGVTFLKDRARDPEGGFYSRFSADGPITGDRLERTSQDLAYALVGLAMNAYLTGNPDTIRILAESRNYIFDNYYDRKAGLMKWVLKDSRHEKTTQLELVAQLDQINAYLLLALRLMPEEIQKGWAEDVRKMISAMNENFFDQKSGSFLGCLQDDSCRDLKAGKHLDFGHRVKAWWMEYLAGLMLKDGRTAEAARRGMQETLSLALKPDGKGWYQDSGGSDAAWWVWAELDQSALTLALTDHFFVPDTFRVLLEDLTDHQYGEWKFGMKTHLWRSGFHSTEHALVGAILSSALREKQTGKKETRTLYFAPSGHQDMKYYPYLYSGRIAGIRKNGGITAVTFESIGLPEAVEPAGQ
ncbi:MAG: hypothetical protein IJ523_12095 [Succinivibrionaceae bacterium]|nr:hypothetical protein [Succinivibrionaceae bacterium]